MICYSCFYLLLLNKIGCFYLTVLNKSYKLALETNKKRNAKGSI